MKHTFKVGDGMTTENSTAEERREIRDLLIKEGYSMSLGVREAVNFNDDSICWDSNLQRFSWIVPVTNPLTYQQMKNYIQPTMNTTQAIELLKKGELQIEITDLFEVIMFASKNRLFPQFSYFNNNNYAYFDGDFMRGRECALQDVRVIKLCDIVDDEPTEQHKTPFDFIMPRVEKAIARGLSDFNAIEAINSGLKHDIYATQQFKELTVKPIELEVGKWYKRIPQCHDKYIKFTFKEYGGSNYGFDTEENWLESIGVYRDSENVIEMTPAEVTEALKKEAVKLGLVEKYFVGLNYTDEEKVCPINEWSFSMKHNRLYTAPTGQGGKIAFQNGKWATVAKTISLKDAEKELGKKIIV